MFVHFTPDNQFGYFAPEESENMIEITEDEHREMAFYMSHEGFTFIRENDEIKKIDSNWPKEGLKNWKNISPNVWEEIIPEEVSSEKLEMQIRSHRDNLLKNSDWTQLPDVPKGLKTIWAKYRQELRDVPQQEEFPKNVIWPEEPK